MLNSFEPATAKRASAACAPLAAWVRANLAYAAAAARVRPLQAQQARLHKNLVAAEKQLHALSSGLATVEERVAALQQQLGQHSRDAAALELSLSNATSTIAAATALIATLAQEYDAWETDGGEISLRPEGTAQVPLYASAARETALAWLRAPLARPLARPLAALHAVALAVAPAAD
ncbi:cytoplasmic dynein 2 heavy chain 1-like [Ostrinia nubilalis]|uniref:cytoplasmic dynein 2 heavy chain 1-like n=1 Tax=Ostrinia nubilalis TaxID=29057 RepID=UPI00308251C0